MFVRSESDHPIDQISSGLMMAIGGEPVDDILVLVDQQLQVVQRELAAVPSRAEGRGSDFVAKARPQLDKLLEALKAYGSWLESAKEALETSDTNGMVDAHEASHDILPKLNQAVQDYSGVFAAFGSYQSVPANGLDHLADGIVSGEVQPPAWKEMVTYYLGGLKQKVDAVKEIDLPGKTALIQGYEDAHELMKSFTSFNPKAKSSFAQQLKDLDDAVHKSEQLEFAMSGSMAGETTIPATNVLIGLIAALKAGSIDKDSLDSAIDDYSEIIDQFSETFEDSASKPIDSVLVQDEIPRTLDYLDEHYAAVEELIAALEGDDAGAMDKAAAGLISSAKKLDESRTVYATATQHEGKILCPNCSRSNPPENRVCEACGESLPRTADASSLASSTFSVIASQQVLEENQQLEMTENVARLFNACDDVAVGKITNEQFLSEVRKAQTGLKELGDDLDEIAEGLMDRSSFSDEQWAVWESQHLPHLEDVAQGFIHGMTESKEGLEEMALFAEDPNNDYLVKGIRRVWEGLGAIHRANLSFQTYSKMLADILSEVSDQQEPAEA